MLKLTLPANRLYGTGQTSCADASSCVNCATTYILRNLDIMVEVCEGDNRHKKLIAVKLDSILSSDELDIEVIRRNLDDLTIDVIRSHSDIESKRAIMDIRDILVKMLTLDMSTKTVSLLMTDIIDILDKRIFADKAGELYKAAFTSESPDVYAFGTPVHNSALFMLKQAIVTAWPGLDNSDIKHIMDMWYECAGTITYCANWHIHRMSR
jgi:hypothetical protein